MHRSVYLIPVVFVLTVSLLSCAGGVPPFPIRVSIPQEFTSVLVNGPAVQLTAKVTNDSFEDKGVVWTLTAEGADCQPACGTLAYTVVPSFSATYTPPKSVPLGPGSSPTITATSVTDPTKFASFSFTIKTAELIYVSISGVFQTVLVGGPPQPLTATVTNDNAGVTWSLTANGSNCSPACGQLVSAAPPALTAVYSPPTSLPTGAAGMPTITATSITDPSRSINFSFTIEFPQTVNYVFLLRGYNNSGAPMAMAGAITVDSNGHVFGGELDINDGGTILYLPSIQGSTQSFTSFESIVRGTVTFNTVLTAGLPSDLSFNFALSSDQKTGVMTEIDSSNFRTVGKIIEQDPTALATPAGSFAFGFDSDAPVGSRLAQIGEFSVGGGDSLSGILDQAGAGSSTTFSAENISGGSLTSPDSLGRGTLSISAAGVTTQYAYYIVDSSLLDTVQIGQGPASGTVQAGVARARTSALTADSVNSTSVFQMTGMNSQEGAVGPDVVIGQMSITGDVAAGLLCDSNDLGAILQATHLSGTVSSFDPSTGRGVLTVPTGFSNGFVDSAVFYLVDSGDGFLLDGDSAATSPNPNRAFSGTLIPQSAGPFVPSMLSSTYLGLSGASAAPAIPNFDAAVTGGQTSGSLLGFVDWSAEPALGGNLTDVSFTATFSIVDSSSGRATAVVPTGFFGPYTSHETSPAVLYIVGPSQFVMIGAQNGLNSGVIQFFPQ